MIVGGLHSKTTNSDPPPLKVECQGGGGLIWALYRRSEHADLSHSDLRAP
jgi:hypothetical protein